MKDEEQTLKQHNTILLHFVYGILCMVFCVEIYPDSVGCSAKLLWEQFQKKAELYQGGVILVPMGDDFYYSKAKAWDTQFVPVTKLMDYINNADYMNTKVRHLSYIMCVIR